MGRIMIAGTSSGCGKTTILCAVLQALVNRGKRVASFKCGPDYIDPMFHSRIIGTKARNLDGFFMDKDTLNYLLERGGCDMDISVLEGVMGYYDGLAMEETASSYAVARDTDTPVVLVVPCQGMSRSIQALLGGYLDFAEDSGICGAIFNQLPPQLYPAMEDYCRGRGIRALGFFPKMEEVGFSSRHLGLVTAAEVDGWKSKMQILADMAEKYLDLEGLLELAGRKSGKPGVASGKPRMDSRKPGVDSGKPGMDSGKLGKECRKLVGVPEESDRTLGGPVRIGVARDLAFCFYYEDNLDLLREIGCELVEFSPLYDRNLPEGLDGLILGGGYPEVYGKELEQNASMRLEIRQSIENGLPTYAECGGYLYLHRQITDVGGQVWQMAGVLDGEAVFMDRLQHFGYVTLTAQADTLLCRKGDVIRAHEFHRYRSTVEQNVFLTEKSGKSWGSFVSRYHLLAGFPHIHYYACPDFAAAFYHCCRLYQMEGRGLCIRQ